MKKILPVLLLVMAAALACRKESEVKPLSEYESADVKAKAYNFHVFPGATFRQDQTELLRRAHFVLQPKAKEAPPMAVYETDAPLEDVAKFYAAKYSYPQIAESESANFSSVKPLAYYTSGDLAADAQGIKPILEKLGMNSDVSRAVGKYRGAYIAPQANLPRVSLQRPYYDSLKQQVVDRTLIVMVRE